MMMIITIINDGRQHCAIAEADEAQIFHEWAKHPPSSRSTLASVSQSAS